MITPLDKSRYPARWEGGIAGSLAESNNPELDEAKRIKKRRDWCHAAFDEASHWLSEQEEARKVDDYISYLMGNQWPTRRPSYKSSPVNNRLLRSLERTVSVLTDIRHSYEIRALDDNYQQIADILTRLTKAWWVNQDNDLQMAMAVIHSYLSTGYLRVSWNKRLMGGLGDFQLTPHGISQLMPIGPHHDLQMWEGAVFRSMQPLSWFRRQFAGPGHKVQASSEGNRYARRRDIPPGMTSAIFGMLSPQMQRVMAGGSVDYVESILPQAPYTEFWIRDDSINASDSEVMIGGDDSLPLNKQPNWAYQVKPGEPLYPRGRLIITGGDDHQVVHDGPNFHWHGRWPFIPVRLKCVPWQFHGISELRTKIGHQDIVNNILAGILDMIKLAVNPPLIYPSNAFSTAVQNSIAPGMPGAKLAYSPASTSPPRYGESPQLPSFVFQMLNYSQTEMDDDSGLVDLQGMARKKVTPAGDTLESLKESQQTIMRLRGRMIEYAMRELGEQMKFNFCQFYTTRRRTFMLGTSGLTADDVVDWDPAKVYRAGVSPHEHIRHLAFVVQNGSLLNVNREAQVQLMMAMRNSPRLDMSRRTLFQFLDMGALVDKVEAELKTEQQEALEQAMNQQAGKALQGMLGG